MMLREAYVNAGKASLTAVSRIFGRDAVVRYSRKHASREFFDNIAFAGMDIEPEEAFSLALVCAIASFAFIAFAGAAAILAGVMDGGTVAIIVLCAGIVPLLAYVYVGEYPKRAAAYMKVRSLGDVPEVVSYIVMSMKLNPNMELALKFAACNSRRQLANDIKKLMWDLQVRAYDSIDGALAVLADNGGASGEHFKRSVFLIKSATCERDEAMRMITLNRALDVVLAGTRSLMGSYSAALHSSTLILYSVFVMVPLALVAMLPAASIIGLRVNAFELLLMYDVLFPLATLVYAHRILMKRPAAFSPSEIPAGHPGAATLPRWAWAVISLASGLVPLVCYVMMPYSILLVWSVTATISVYCLGVYGPYKKVRDGIAAMEEEFADSLFVLGRRISDGRSPEEAFAYTARMVSGSAIGRSYARAAYNVSCMRASLKDAVLDPVYGAFSDVYSDRILATIGMLVESSDKSGDIAGSSVVRLADHLKELQAIEDDIRKMLYTMTSMLRTTCLAFAPFIGGVTLALSQSVSGVIADTLKDLQGMPESARAYFPMLPEFTAPAVSQEEFVIIVGLYILFLVIILLRFVDGIEHGDDRYEFMYSVGKTLPVSMAIFTITTMMSGSLFGGMM